MKKKSTFKSIYDATSEAELNFLEREKILREAQLVDIKPLITRLINKINTESMTVKDFVNDLTYVKDQLTLRGELRKQSSIIKKSQNVLVRIRSLALVELLPELHDQISSTEKVTIEHLIHKLKDAIKQKNYSVMKELNEEIQLIFPTLCDLD